MTRHPEPLLERYRDLLAGEDESFPISLGEGGTPLIHARRLGAEIGLENLHLKVEGANPTGSFKDRGMVLAVNRAVAAGARAVVCASTGNTRPPRPPTPRRRACRATSSCRRARWRAARWPRRWQPGAKLIMVDGNFDAALAAVRRLGEEGLAVVVNSINPDRLTGQQTAAFEIVDALGARPDALALPVGNAGNITAYWRGFRALRRRGAHARRRAAPHARLPGGGRRPDRARRAGRVTRDGGHRDPHRQPRLLAAGGRGARRVRRR